MLHQQSGAVYYAKYFKKLQQKLNFWARKKERKTKASDDNDDDDDYVMMMICLKLGCSLSVFWFELTTTTCGTRALSKPKITFVCSQWWSARASLAYSSTACYAQVVSSLSSLLSVTPFSCLGYDLSPYYPRRQQMSSSVFLYFCLILPTTFAWTLRSCLRSQITSSS